LLLLLPDDFFSPPWLLRLLLEPPLEALALPLRSEDDALVRLPLLEPLLDPRPEEDEDFELPDFMEISFGKWRGTVRPATGPL
jgi:hypothetical protein